MSKQSMLTTIDNPFNPFDDYENWLTFDTTKNYNTNSLLARVVKSSNELTEQTQQELIEEAIDEIVKENVSGVHIKRVMDLP